MPVSFIPLDPTAGLQSVDPRHHYIGEHQIDPAAADYVKRFPAIIGCDNQISGRAKRSFQKFQVARFIINTEYYRIQCIQTPPPAAVLLSSNALTPLESSSGETGFWINTEFSSNTLPSVKISFVYPLTKTTLSSGRTVLISGQTSLPFFFGMIASRI